MEYCGRCIPPQDAATRGNEREFRHARIQRPAGSRFEAIDAIESLSGVAATAAAAGASHTDSFTGDATSAIRHELDASEVALRRSQRDDVREFATRMREDFARVRDDPDACIGDTTACVPVTLMVHQPPRP